MLVHTLCLQLSLTLTGSKFIMNLYNYFSPRIKKITCINICKIYKYCICKFIFSADNGGKLVLCAQI